MKMKFMRLMKVITKRKMKINGGDQEEDADIEAYDDDDDQRERR